MKSWQLWLPVWRIKSVEKVWIVSHHMLAKNKLAGIKKKCRKPAEGEEQANMLRFYTKTRVEAQLQSHTLALFPSLRDPGADENSEVQPWTQFA